MKHLPYFSLFVAFFLSGCASEPPAVQRSTLTVGTFNIAWLGDGVEDEIPRSQKDLENIRSVLAATKADVLALQEIENEDALKRLAVPGYKWRVSSYGGKQNVAFLYRSSISVESFQELRSLEIDPGRSRPGLLAKFRCGNFDALLLNVHLKSTSRFDSTDQLRAKSIDIRSEQVKVLAKLVDSLVSVGKERDIIVLGDFNDFPLRSNRPSLGPMVKSQHGRFLTDSVRSCWNQNRFVIDNVFASNSVVKRVDPATVRSFSFPYQLSEAESRLVSDHCPVLFLLDCGGADED